MRSAGFKYQTTNYVKLVNSHATTCHDIEGISQKSASQFKGTSEVLWKRPLGEC